MSHKVHDNCFYNKLKTPPNHFIGSMPHTGPEVGIRANKLASVTYPPRSCTGLGNIKYFQVISPRMSNLNHRRKVGVPAHAIKIE